MKKISQLPYFEVNESLPIEMVVTVPPINEFRQVHIKDHCYSTELAAIERIRDIYKGGNVPFILPIAIETLPK